MMPDLGVLLVVWRMAPDLSGQIRRCLVVFLLTAVLPRTEAEGRDAAGDSINRALVGSLVSDMGDGAISSPGRDGSEGRRKKADAACSAVGLCWGWCSSSWSSPSATQNWSLNLIAVRRLLLMPTILDIDDTGGQVTRLLTDAVGSTCDQRLRRARSKLRRMYFLMDEEERRCKTDELQFQGNSSTSENDGDQRLCNLWLGTATTCAV